MVKHEDRALLLLRKQRVSWEGGQICEKWLQNFQLLQVCFESIDFSFIYQQINLNFYSQVKMSQKLQEEEEPQEGKVD